MRRTKKCISYIPECECYRVDELEMRAYFNYQEIKVFYQFESVKELEKWKLGRSMENRANKRIEDFQACDKNGCFSFEKYYSIRKTMGLPQEKPKSLVQEIYQGMVYK